MPWQYTTESISKKTAMKYIRGRYIQYCRLIYRFYHKKVMSFVKKIQITAYLSKITGFPIVALLACSD